MKIGSPAHKERFCHGFIASHRRYDPETLPWPEIDPAAAARLRAIPFWQEVLYTERRAGAIVAAFAGTVSDPLVRQAIELQGVEEARHADLLRVMIRRYGIAAEETPLAVPGPDLYRAFADFGYGECLDSFLGFGVFHIARHAGYLPEALFDIFDMLIHEEARHIVFFVNWMAWHGTQRGLRAGWLRAPVAGYFYARAVGRLLGTVWRGRRANDGKDFSATQAGVFLDGFSLRRLIAECRGENARRMDDFDGELLRPRLIPALAGLALAMMRIPAPSRAVREERA